LTAFLSSKKGKENSKGKIKINNEKNAERRACIEIIVEKMKEERKK
jgi:hypothetical protein